MQIISGRPRDLGGFQVRRLLPAMGQRMVGPFIFFDHMGPAIFAAGQGMDVRPHPHIGLATVTYLFKGALLHRDSLGTVQEIEPGDINWMTAGRGIVHSERTPPRLRQQGFSIEGIQAWVALPEEHEEAAPSFAHHPGESLPEVEMDGARVKILVGHFDSFVSPVRCHGDVLYLDALVSRGRSLQIKAGERQLGIYVVTGDVSVGDTRLGVGVLGALPVGIDLEVRVSDEARFLVLGGKPLQNKREIWWNFVSSSLERMERAKRDWAEGRFPKIPGDDQDQIPLPDDRRKPGQ